MSKKAEKNNVSADECLIDSDGSRKPRKGALSFSWRFESLMSSSV